MSFGFDFNGEPDVLRILGGGASFLSFLLFSHWYHPLKTTPGPPKMCMQHIAQNIGLQLHANYKSCISGSWLARGILLLAPLVK